MTALRVPSAGQLAGTAVTVAQKALSGGGPAGRSSPPSGDPQNGVHHGKTLTPQKARNINFVCGPQPREKEVRQPKSHGAFHLCFF